MIKIADRCDTQVRDRQASRRTPAGNAYLDSRGYIFGRNPEHVLTVASTLSQRREAWALVYQRYFAKHYVEPRADELWYGLHDTLPRTTTFLVKREEKVIATVGLAFDSPFGLPADELYRAELDPLRLKKRRLCEIMSLAGVEETSAGFVRVLLRMFKLAYLTARHLEQATDFVIAVHPRHADFYKRKLLFEYVGPAKACPKVNGAPAVLLRLNLETAWGRYERLASPTIRQIFLQNTHCALLRWLEEHRSHRPISFTPDARSQRSPPQ